MRRAKSYSIVDHNLLHGGFLRRMSREGMALYLFLVVVGDRNGRSFYSDISVMEILRLDDMGLSHARAELCAMRLIDYRRPYWHVSDISEQGGDYDGRGNATGKISQGGNEAFVSPDRERDRDIAKERIKAISRLLSGKDEKAP